MSQLGFMMSALFWNVHIGSACSLPAKIGAYGHVQSNSAASACRATLQPMHAELAPLYAVDTEQLCMQLHSKIQEAQLSQRDRATLRVIEYSAKSHEVVRNDTVA